MSWPAVVLWIMIFAAGVSRGPWLIYLTFASGAFGTLQMLPGEGGGVNLLPQSACAAIFVLKVLLHRGNIPRALHVAFDPLRMATLTGFIIYSSITAFVLPRLFAGLTDVVPVSGFTTGLAELGPSGGNVTQSAYMLVFYGTTVSFAVIGGTEDMRRHFALANVFAGIVIVGTGLIDLLFFTAGISDLLSPFRTATYALLTDTEVDDGIKRVVGLTPEASAYGGLCLGVAAILVFLGPVFRKGRENTIALSTAVMLLVMAALSTSSGTYVGLGILCAVYGCHLVARLISRDPRYAKRSRIELGVLFGLMLAAAAAFIIAPNLFNPAYDMVDKMVFQKTASASYIERSSWTRAGWQAFLDSGGLGVGIGSIRVSNWAVSIIGSTGVFGALLLFSFVAQQILLKPPGVSPQVRQFCSGVQLSLIPVLAVAQLSATMPDPGFTIASALGILAAQWRSSASTAAATAPSSARQTSGLLIDNQSGIGFGKGSAVQARVSDSPTV